MPTMTSPSSSSQQLWQFEPCTDGIVVGFDGSPSSHAALESAGALAAARKCPVHVISVLRGMSSYRLDPGNDQSPSQVNDLRIQLRDAAIRDAIGSIHERADWTRQVVVGSVAEEIAKAAEARGADMILVGRTDRGVIDRLLGGESTLQLMRSCSIPVLVIGDEMGSPRTIVVAVDFGPASTRAASLAIELLRGSGTLYLVYVEGPIEVLPDGTLAGDLESHPGDVVMRFRWLTSQLRAPNGVVVETVMLSGSAAHAILEFSERVGADVLAVGTHGLKGIQRFLLGSVSTALVRNSEKPILVVPAGRS